MGLSTLFVFSRLFPKGSWERKVKAYGFDEVYLSLLHMHRYFMDVTQEWLLCLLYRVVLLHEGMQKLGAGSGKDISPYHLIGKLT